MKQKLRLSDVNGVDTLLTKLVDRVDELRAVEQEFMEVFGLCREHLSAFRPVSSQDFRDRERFVAYLAEIEQVARAIAAVRRQSADCVCRLGGDYNRELAASGELLPA